MVIRELLAVFGLDYDGKGQEKAEKGLTVLKNQAEGLATVFSQLFAVGAIATPFLFLANMASDANENLNLLNLAFGDNADAIVEWSNKTAPAIGRSRFTLRELAAEFGGLLAPMIDSEDQLAQMSTGLAELAVDLSSARNITEKEGLLALQSGLSGNIISMRRFGVNLSAARVESEALSRGLSKNTKDLTQGQLASIRYSLIMEDLAFIQGDAAATLDQFANSTRALRDAMKDIGTEIGLFLLPAFESSLKTTRELLQPVRVMAVAFREWAADTNLAAGAVLALSLIMGATLLPLLLKILPFMIAFAVFAVILDDVITAFQGGDSVLLNFAKTLDALESEGFPGMGTAMTVAISVLNRFRDVIGGVMAAVVALFEGVTTGDFRPFLRTINVLEESFNGWLDSMGAWGRGFKAVLNALTAPLEGLALVMAGVVEALATGSVAPLRGALEGLKELGQSKVANFRNIAGQAPSGTTGGSRGLLQGGNFNTQDQAGLGRESVVVRSGDSFVNITVQQEPGESGEDFAQRVAEIVDDQQAQRDQAIASELIQTAQ